MNAQVHRDEKNKFFLQNMLNKNDEHQINFSQENIPSCLNTRYHKREKKLWIHTNTDNIKALLYDILVKKMWINNAFKCEAYFSFDGISFDHRIVSGKIRLSLRRNKKQTVKILCFSQFPIFTYE